jgi:hypothetical protein
VAKGLLTGKVSELVVSLLAGRSKRGAGANGAPNSKLTAIGIATLYPSGLCQTTCGRARARYGKYAKPVSYCHCH